MKITNQTVKARQAQHTALEQLARSLNPTNTASGLSLWRRLHRIEIQAHRATEAYSNGTMGEQACDQACERAADAVRRIFGGVLPPQFHVNRDPRGYALKLLSNGNGTEAATKFSLHSDWGRNQILAPQID